MAVGPLLNRMPMTGGKPHVGQGLVPCRPVADNTRAAGDKLPMRCPLSLWERESISILPLPYIYS